MEVLYTADIPKLKDLCTNSIVKHFDRLMLALESKKVPQMPYEYLQRVQSIALFKILSKKRKYSRYVKFLLNPFIKDINLKLCVWDNSVVASQLMVIADTIRNLTIYGRCFSTHHVSPLACKMTSLQSLSLSSINVTRLALQNIGKYCTSLRILNISFSTSVTDEAITALCFTEESGNNSFRKNHVLQHLDIRKTFVTAVGVAFILEHFPNIEFIRHHSVFDALCNIHVEYLEDDIRSNLKIYNLKKLIISNKEQYFHIPALKLCNSLCPYVNELSVGYISTQPELEAITKYPALTKACIISPIDVYLDLSFFIEMRGNNLEMLVLKDSTVSVQALLKFCPKLKKLRLEDIHFKSTEAEDATGRDTLPHLRDFAIECVDFTLGNVLNSVSIILSAAPNLEELTFLSVDALALDFVDSIVTHECLENIQELNIINSDVEAAAARKLLSICPNIKIFSLKDTPMRFQDYKALKMMRPSIKIITDYTSFVFDSVDEDETSSEHSWMNDHDDEIFVLSNESLAEDSEFEPPSTDVEEDEENSSIDLDEEFNDADQDDEFQPDNDDDDDELEISRAEMERFLDILINHDISTDDDEYEPSWSEYEISDTDEEGSLSTDEDENPNFNEVEHDSSSDEEPQSKRRRLDKDSVAFSADE